MKLVALRFAVAVLMVLAPGVVAADLIVDQPANTGLDARVAQVFPDLPEFSAFEFDDFQTLVPYNLMTLTVFGFEGGIPALNTAVTAEIWDGLPGSGSVVLSVAGTEDSSGNLQFDFAGQLLQPGMYWLTAYVTRPFSGGQWFWSENLPVRGSESFFYNPGGAFGFGTVPIPGSAVFDTAANQAFILQGDPAEARVPAPSSLALLGASFLGMAVYVRRNRRGRTA